METIYYVYVYCDPRMPYDHEFMNIKFNHIPFYIGMGKGLRLLDHLKEKKNKRKNKRIDIIRETNSEPIIDKLFDSLTKNQAFYIEACLIDHFKLVENGGYLLNETKPNIKKWEGRQESPAMKYQLDYFDPLEIVKYPTIKYVILNKSFEIVSIHYSLGSASKEIGLTRSLTQNLSENAYPLNSLRNKIIVRTENLLKVLYKNSQKTDTELFSDVMPKNFFLE